MRSRRQVSERLGEFIAPKPVPRRVSAQGLEAAWKALERRNFRIPGYPHTAGKCAKELIERDG